MHITYIQLFQTTKIQIFESNSQPTLSAGRSPNRLFQTTKIQIFESNSQQVTPDNIAEIGCFRLQRYKILITIYLSL